MVPNVPEAQDAQPTIEVQVEGCVRLASPSAELRDRVRQELLVDVDPSRLVPSEARGFLRELSK